MSKCNDNNNGHVHDFNRDCDMVAANNKISMKNNINIPALLTKQTVKLPSPQVSLIQQGSMHSENAGIQTRMFTDGFSFRNVDYSTNNTNGVSNRAPMGLQHMHGQQQQQQLQQIHMHMQPFQQTKHDLNGKNAIYHPSTEMHNLFGFNKHVNASINNQSTVDATVTSTTTNTNVLHSQTTKLTDTLGGSTKYSNYN